MFAADLAERFVSELHDNLTEIIIRQKRTAVTLTETEAGCTLGQLIDLLAETFPELSRNAFVKPAGIGIDIDLPARTAGIAAA